MIFDRSLIKELQNTAGAVFTVIFTIVLTIGLVRILNMAVGGQIETDSVAKMVVYQTLANLSPLLTAALFIAVLLTLMRSWIESEMVVWFSSGGICLARWIKPVIFFALPVYIFIAALSVSVSPWAKFQMNVTKTNYAQKDDVSRLMPGKFIEIDSGKQVVFIEDMDKKTSKVKNIFFLDTSHNKSDLLIAETGSVFINENGERYIDLQNGRKYSKSKSNGEQQVANFEQYLHKVNVKPDKIMTVSDADMMTFKQVSEDPSREAQAEVFWRLSWPIAAFILTMIAIPLSYVNSRVGRSINMLLALLIFVAYLNGLNVSRAWIEQGKITLWASLISINGLFLLLAVVLFLRRTIMLTWNPVYLFRK